MNANIIIAGGRDFTNYQTLKLYVDKIKQELNITKATIVSGLARGADMLGIQYANEHKHLIVRFPAQWDVYGKRAGFIRNDEMLKYIKKQSDTGIVIAFWDGKSKGTKHMIDAANKMNIQCFVCKY